jgi:hypothetical protein
MENTDKKNQAFDKFLKKKKQTENEEEQIVCDDNVCYVKSDKSLIERVNKKIILDDGRQLLT